MPEYTENYGLAKPYEVENYDINVHNDNMDKIDDAIKDINDDLTQHKLDYIQQRQQDNLKVAKVEKDLNDYQKTLSQVNVNQEAKQKATGYGVISLPPNAANGQVSVAIGGQTWTNLIDGAEVAPDDSRTFDSIDGHIYFDLYNGVIIAGDGTEKTVINAGDESANMAVFDLTQIYGQGNEPTAEQAQARLYYINDTKSTISASRLKSVGKNLFDGKVEINRYLTDTGLKAPSSNWCIIDYIKVEGNTTYIASGYSSSGTNPSVGFFDNDYNFISGLKHSNTNPFIFTTPSNCAYIRDSVRISDIESYQLEKGTVSTQYEPYKESNAYVIATDKDTGEILELRSLPNGTKDEVRVSEGKKDKRISDEVVGVALGTVINYADMAEGGQYYAWNEAGETETGVKGDTLGIDNATLTYQLAESIEIPVQVSGNIVSHPSGTVYIEPATTAAGVYSSGISVTEQELGIKELEKISKIDFNTGLETQLDVSLAVIATDRLSFTHPDLLDGDIVFFGYMHNLEGTAGEATIEYYDSRYTIKDSVTDKFYKWDITVADGVPSIALQEV